MHMEIPVTGALSPRQKTLLKLTTNQGDRHPGVMQFGVGQSLRTLTSIIAWQHPTCHVNLD